MKAKLFFLSLIVVVLLSAGKDATKKELPIKDKNKIVLAEQNYQFLYNFVSDTVKVKKYWDEIAAGLKRAVFIKIETQTLTIIDFVDTFSVVLETKISSGRFKKSTPHGEFTVLKKRISRPSKKYGGLMTYWSCLTPNEAIGIHGLKDVSYEKDLGKPVSHGCIRIGKDIEKEFYVLTPIGTKVVIE